MTRVFPEPDPKTTSSKEELHNPMRIADKVWDLNTSEKLKGLTWWWWPI